MKKIAVLSLPFFFSLSLFAQQNIAPLASAIQTSFVSSWENLYAVNNEIDPVSSSDKTGGAYGNWSGTDNVWQWVEYDWDKLYMISGSDIYWWADGSGIRIPYDTYIRYWDFRKKDWAEFTGLSGNGTEADQYNHTSFDPVLTNKIRVYMISTIATGILEWKVWGQEGEQVPVNSSLEASGTLQPGAGTQFILTAKDNSNNPVAGYVFKLDASVNNELPASQESYLINGVSYTAGVSGLELPPTNASGETFVQVELPASIDPMDGISLRFFFNEHYTTIGDSYAFYQPGLSSPVLSPDINENTVDHNLELTFTDDAAWRGELKAVFSGDSELTSPADYLLQEGKLILLPNAAQPALSKSGSRTIRITARGYEDATATQIFLSGCISPDSTRISTSHHLYAPSKNDILIDLKDRFGNAVPDSSLRYSAAVTNLSPEHYEVFTLGGTDVSTTLPSSLTTLSGPDGRSTLSLSIPYEIDHNDGITIAFELKNGTPLKDTITYFNDGSAKEIVLQQAVRSNAGFSWDRTAQSANFIVYWGQKITGDPRDAVNGSIAFDPYSILDMMEALLAYMTDSVHFIDNPETLNMARYKHEIVMNETWESGFTGWAFGGSADGKIGGMWIHPQATSGPAILAHEFTHMCQAMILLQYPGYGLNASYAGFFWESHAEFMRKNYVGSYQDVQTSRYIFTSMMQYSTTRRHYQNIYFLDYLMDKYGLETIHQIWRKASPVSSHPLTSLRDSVLRYTQSGLNDDFAFHAMKNVNWDYSSGAKIRQALRAVDPIWIQRQYTVPDTVAGENGLYIVPEYLAPADYGYNLIPLYPEEGSSAISLSFAGLENQASGGAGWRYGFVTTGRNGEPGYSDLYTGDDSQAVFPISPDDSLIFLVVTGAPLKHHNYQWEPGYPRIYRYPYTFRLSGAKPAGYSKGYNNRHESLAGAPHANGGGWVASTATVASTAYVGPDAQVLGSAQVLDNARIEDFAIVSDNARVSNSAVVRNHAEVGRGAVIKNHALIEKSARVFNTSTIQDSAVVTGSALVYGSTLRGRATAKDLATLNGVTLSGTAIVGGDGEEYTGCSAGTYLQINRSSSCDGMIDHPLNLEVNPAWENYYYPLGDKPSIPGNLQGSALNDHEVLLVWDEAADLQETESYYVYVEGNLVRTVDGTSAIIGGLQPASTYSFAVKALDRSKNVSLLSEIIDLTTSAAGVEDAETPGLFLYPNPTQGVLTVRSPFNGLTCITLCDMGGKEVYRSVISGETTLDLAGYHLSGTYVVRLSDSKESVTGKVLFR
ncbi:MAG: DUF6055 domain-containing protein [Bacteroidota bacterium]